MALDAARVPLSLYVHLPWCVRKCPYCDFNSHALRDSLPEQAYRTSLLADLESELSMARERPVVSIFFGGGTPSLVSPHTIGAVIDLVAHRGMLAADAEITLEANPGASDRARFGGYRDAGVNRLSIGAQSFNNRLLHQIGRIHDARQARSAVEGARDAGFDDINIDLMFGLPGQNRADAAADVEAAIALAPSHLSYYQLTLEPNTLFHAKPPPLPDEDEIHAMHEYGLARVRAGGWFRYEVSAFARSGRECRHNRNYWEFGDYLAVGAGAHGKLSADGRVTRFTKPRHPRDYMARTAPFRSSESSVEGEDLVFEFLLNALRLREGFTLSLFEARTGIDRAVLEARLAPLAGSRLLRVAGERVRCTDRGYAYLNEILEKLLPEPADREASAQ